MADWLTLEGEELNGGYWFLVYFIFKYKLLRFFCTIHAISRVKPIDRSLRKFFHVLCTDRIPEWLCRLGVSNYIGQVQAVNAVVSVCHQSDGCC